MLAKVSYYHLIHRHVIWSTLQQEIEEFLVLFSEYIQYMNDYFLPQVDQFIILTSSCGVRINLILHN